MGHRIMFATGNEGKMREIRLILADSGLSMPSMKEAGAEPEIVKDGTTLRENVEIKARVVWNPTGDIVLADGFGLEVDHTGGEPGIYSARYLGEDTPYGVKDRSIIERLKEAMGQERDARFVCSIVAMLPDGRVLHTKAVTGGSIAGKSAGSGGFGYDPIPYLSQFGKTFTEIIMEQRNEISHKGKALRAMKGALEGMLKQEMKRTKDKDANRQ